MNLTGVRAFLRERLDGLSFKEWKDGFNTDNIPSTILDKSYHIMSPAGSGVSLSMHDQVVNFDQQVSIFRRGFRNPAAAIDSTVSDVQTILCDLLAPEQRLADKLNVILQGFTIEPLGDDNDNSVKATINLSVQVTFGFT